MKIFHSSKSSSKIENNVNQYCKDSITFYNRRTNSYQSARTKKNNTNT